jgi:hypothetical protein
METAPSDAEWDVYLAALAAPLQSGRFRGIVITEGAYPTRAQQARDDRAHHRQAGAHRDSLFLQRRSLVVSIFALMNRDVKAYSPRDYQSAFTHLGLAPAERPGVARFIDRLREKRETPELVTSRRRRAEFPPVTAPRKPRAESR